MIRVNLLPVRVSRRFEAVKNELVIAGMVALAMVLGAGAFQYTVNSDVNAKEAQVAQLKGKKNKNKKMDAELEELRADNKRMEDRRQIIKTLQAKKHGPVHMLDEIAKATPDKLQLLELEEHKGQIRLVGIASTDPEIAEFAHRLEQSPYFDGVYINSTEQTVVLDAKVKKFTITAKLIVVIATTETTTN